MSVPSCLTSCCQAGHLALADSYFYAKPCSCNCRCKTKWRLKTIFTSTLQSPSCCAPQMFRYPFGPIYQGCFAFRLYTTVLYRNQTYFPLSSHRQSMPSAGPVIVGAISELCHSSYQPLQRYLTTSLFSRP